MRTWIVIGLLLIPGTAAWQAELSEMDAPLIPDVNVQPMTLTITVPCSELPFHVDSTNTIVAAIQWEAPQEISIVGPDVSAFTANPCLSGSPAIEHDVQFMIGATREAPGLTDVPVVATVQISSNPTNQNPGPQTATASVPVGYFADSQMKIANPLQKVGPGKQANYQIELHNFGNAKTVFVLELLSKPAGHQVLPPPPIIVDWAGGETDSTEVATLQVSSPKKFGWTNELGVVEFRVTSYAFEDDTQAGPTLNGTLLLRTRGADAPSIAIPLFVILLAGGAAAFVVWRRRA